MKYFLKKLNHYKWWYLLIIIFLGTSFLIMSKKQYTIEEYTLIKENNLTFSTKDNVNFEVFDRFGSIVKIDGNKIHLMKYNYDTIYFFSFLSLMVIIVILIMIDENIDKPSEQLVNKLISISQKNFENSYKLEKVMYNKSTESFLIDGKFYTVSYDYNISDTKIKCFPRNPNTELKHINIDIIKNGQEHIEI